MQKFDLVIPCKQLDYVKLPFVVSAAFNNLIGLRNIHIIAQDPENINLTYIPYRNRVILHCDDHVLPYDRNQLQYRPSWIFQQYLKLLQDVTTTDWYLATDSDIIVNKKMPMWDADSKPIMYVANGGDVNADYFEFNRHMLGDKFAIPPEFSLITECMFYNKQLVQAMLDYCGFTRDQFWDRTVELSKQGIYPAETILYGNYILKQHPGVYSTRYLLSSLGGKYGEHMWTQKEIAEELAMKRVRNPDAHLISIHSWQ